MLPTASNVSRTYTLIFNSYQDIREALRKLRKRRVRIHLCVMVVSAEHWNSVKDLINNKERKVVLILG